MTQLLPPFPAPQDDPGGRTDLTLTPGGETPQLRADAARNRSRLLEVAARLAAERGAANVTMEAVACGAGVGKGTVFRRFGDRTGLLEALLDHHEKQLQAAFLTGPPPLGPDAPPVERLRAFGSAVIRREHTHSDLYLAAHAEAARRHTAPPYQLRLTHVCLLLRQARTEGDIELVAHTLLGYLDTILVDHLLTRRGMTLERVEAGWYDLVDRCTGGQSRCSTG
ncbi:TetR family transcriptional regulator [Streptomyces avermitilis]|uniref:TetR-family transcriptional regulator n=2 Tax=Streptomyces avermitilis TaxID=33903 RepID=Q826X9_STRAW|nr:MULTISPECIES: TetR/AcrR family transcriptional regulator [Streptomyces]KUN53170.1 TetR family transcriptional regulator [Streptomyces avermitilis]MYT02588.1 TetR family transcriptional regulator [Streptomyces sp. SID5469]OOV11645.1 TetR family transcriptional regulator [Streptomyces avermitilis]BAC74757.1 putative TetR-family transcriptional regulator [Streptomyces avermitilis MA-4680 = NBRC 14893]BBJ55360.1 TetR family transcriptional regulator [Streptomyces avermitilis]